MSSDIIGLYTFFFTVIAERANKIKYFLYYYIFSFYFGLYSDDPTAEGGLTNKKNCNSEKKCFRAPPTTSSWCNTADHWLGSTQTSVATLECTPSMLLVKTVLGCTIIFVPQMAVFEKSLRPVIFSFIMPLHLIVSLINITLLALLTPSPP